MEIEEVAYIKFKESYGRGDYVHQRLGQAFFNCFSLHKTVAFKDIADKLYQLDGDAATAFISEHFDIR